MGGLPTLSCVKYLGRFVCSGRSSSKDLQSRIGFTAPGWLMSRSLSRSDSETMSTHLTENLIVSEVLFDWSTTRGQGY